MALNTKGKKSTLNEDAYIYEQRHEDTKTEREKWSTMNRSEKWSYFKSYYLRPLMIGVMILAIIGYFVIVDFVLKKDEVYRCAIMNEFTTDTGLDTFNEGYIKKLGLDTDKYTGAFGVYYTDSTLASSMGSTATTDLTQVSAMIYASTLDSMVGDTSTINHYMDTLTCNAFINLEDYLTPEEYNKLKPYLYIPDLSSNKEGNAYGVYLQNSSTYMSLFDNGQSSIQQPIIAFLINSDNYKNNPEYSRTLLRYLFPDIFTE